ncbi:MAG: hypothetical protein JXR76_01080 [Deltaproteobacteria bacterium]|nr:hypothetical protein [Deltaproteobacteria bacterium]
MKRINTSLIIALLPLVIACFEEFDDPTQAVLKKTEIIGITLNPPEASPGDTVTATVHVADGLGKRPALSAIWMTDGTDSLIPLLGQTVQFVVPSIPDDAYNEHGMAAYMISVAVAKDNRLLENLGGIDDIDAILNSNDVLFGMRTLTVSRTPNAPRTNNPTLSRLALHRADDTIVDIIAAVSTAPDFEAQRQIAMASPLTITEDEEVHFQAVSSAALPGNTLRYQWISTAGDFKSRREAIEPWIAPEYKEYTGGAPADPLNLQARKDPNIHPVFLLIRDDGEPWHLGLTIAEFYVRVVPAP